MKLLVQIFTLIWKHIQNSWYLKLDLAWSNVLDRQDHDTWLKVDTYHNSDKFAAQSIGFNPCHLILIYYGWYTWKMLTFIDTYCFSLLLFFLITFCANTWEMCDKLLISSSSIWVQMNQISPQIKSFVVQWYWMISFTRRTKIQNLIPTLVVKFYN